MNRMARRKLAAGPAWVKDTVVLLILGLTAISSAWYFANHQFHQVIPRRVVDEIVGNRIPRPTRDSRANLLPHGEMLYVVSSGCGSCSASVLHPDRIAVKNGVPVVWVLTNRTAEAPLFRANHPMFIVQDFGRRLFPLSVYAYAPQGVLVDQQNVVMRQAVGAKLVEDLAQEINR